MEESGKTFDIVFRGDIVLGHSLDTVKQRLQQLFKADTAKIDALFIGRPVPLKRNLDEATAKKYQAVLQKAGAEVSLVPAGSQTPSAAPQRPAPVRGLSLAPVGSNLLRPTERSKAPVVNIDVSTLSLRPAGERLLDSAEVKTAPVPVVAPDFDLAAAGEDLIRAEDRYDLPLPELDIEDWGLSEVGEPLLKPEEQSRPAAVKVTELTVDLAPVGSDLGQIKREKNAVVPDVSRLKLED